MYWCGGQFYNLRSDEVYLEENEKIIELISTCAKASVDKQNPDVAVRILFLHTSQENADKKKEKKKANPLEGRGKQSKEERNK
ncbi:MAG: hypothetical protein IM574_13400 [Cytophagales bacterium]|jgi:ATP adenylyltransferase/5',5'''-P-1,P-4-tetraphosphate phosphorylase II|nr:hypothetical protein [Cytophagales bacterium]MCA6388957.1 hypothetical protein [Cytophagales bacterium]MCA6391375.1 hypothetical protein [Cytophagales bacterium]MCA6395355.1 hypothetical protein [Cytophagales bacterium]MCA6400151.1 hypothetical protein [Cytophagales bacterium]